MKETLYGDEKLSGILTHPTIVKLRSSLGERRPLEADDEAGVRRAAVALIFHAGEEGSPELLFIKRAEYPGDPWSGQIAFPGGREERGDASLRETAIRETREETGIDLSCLRKFNQRPPPFSRGEASRTETSWAWEHDSGDVGEYKVCIVPLQR